MRQQEGSATGEREDRRGSGRLAEERKEGGGVNVRSEWRINLHCRRTQSGLGPHT